jgi:hypothetical protein
MMRLAWHQIGLAFVAVCLCASAASAQQTVASLDGLKILESTNTRVTLTDGSGQEFVGTVADAEADRLSLKIGRAVRQFAATDVRTVRVQKEDSLANGAGIGAAVAGGFMVLTLSSSDCTEGFCWFAAGVYTGIGALIGMGIDAGIHRKVLVYSAPSARKAQRVSIDPLIAPRRAGLRFTIAF